MALDGPPLTDGRRSRAATGRVLMAAHVLRFLPMYQALRERLASGRIGAARWAMFRRRCAAPAWSKWLKDPQRSGGGVFDLLIHDVDMCLHLFGMPETVSATGYEALASGIDLIMAELHYPGQGTAFVTGGWHHPKSYPFSMEYTVVADGGTFEYSSAAARPLCITPMAGRSFCPRRRSTAMRRNSPISPIAASKAFAPEFCPPEESAAAVALTRLLLEARNRNGERIECNL